MKEIRGANAILTGASRGIGPYIARALASRGVNLALAARSSEGVERTRGECVEMGVRAVAVACDVTSMDDLRKLVETAERELGPIDILVNNAGIEVTASLAGHGFGQIDDIIRTNLNAPIWLTKLVVPGMVQRGRGAVVNVSSMAGKSITPYNAVYGATKHGLNGFTGSLRGELDGTGVTAGVVCPGFVGEAGMWADGGGKAPALMREVSPRKVAEAVLKVIGGAPEALVTPGPIRPLLAFQELAPGVNKVLLKRMGILQTLRRRAEEYEARQPTPSADSKLPEPVEARTSD
jgi:short-subunit dehydrogenase